MEVDGDELGNCKISKNSKDDKKDNESTRGATEQDFEKEHQHLLRYTEELRTKYHESCRQMISELRSWFACNALLYIYVVLHNPRPENFTGKQQFYGPSHLDEFAQVLLERQKHVLQDRDDLIKEMCEKLVRSLCNSLDKFWEEYDVANRLAALEMLKEQYKKFEGNTWNVLQMDPLQRTLPLRMRYKEVRLHYLEKQLAYQNQQLNKLMEINHRERSRITDMDESRKSLLTSMISCTKDMEEINSRTEQKTCDVIGMLAKD